MQKNARFIPAMLLLLLPAIFTACTETAGVPSPNIILIVTDDQGWTHTSHPADPDVPGSGSDYYETPNLDRLAASGVLFTQGYAPNPICSPTRHSLLFGQNAARHIYCKDRFWYRNTEDWLTIPKVIKQANPDYKTAHIGKWHVAMVPADAGYDHDDGMTSNFYGENFGDGYLRFREYSQQVRDYLKENNVENPAGVRVTGSGTMYWNDPNPKDIFGMTGRAIDYMEQCIREDRPFFVQVSHYATHLSCVAREETFEYFRSKDPGQRHNSPEFGAMLKDLDTGIGMLMNFVEESGISNQTYIFLMGDNGGRECLNQMGIIDENAQLIEAHYAGILHRNIPLREGKHSFYEGGLRVPFLAMGPDIKPGTVCNVPVTGLDFLPTFAELAGYEGDLPAYIDGGSLAPLLFNRGGQVERNREALIFHQALHRPPRSVIRKGDFKLVKIWSQENRYENSPKVELYNLSEDLSETTDLAATYPERVAELEAELLEFLGQVNAETGEEDIRGPYYRLLEEMGIDYPPKE